MTEQNSGTFDMLSLTKQLDSWSSGVLVGLPPLHIKIGVFCKLVMSLDLVFTKLRELNDIEGDFGCCFNDFLSSLPKIGARREKYYSRKLSGGLCSRLMEKRNEFCTMFSELRCVSMVLSYHSYLSFLRLGWALSQ